MSHLAAAAPAPRPSGSNAKCIRLELVGEGCEVARITAHHVPERFG
jgi:hypothetical protein